METSSQCQVSSLAAFHVCIWGRVLHGTRISSVYLCHLHSKAKDLPVFSRITMIAESCHHGCHLASLVLGIALRSHDCTAGASPTEAVSHPSVHLCRGQLSIWRCLNTIPLHLSFFEFCLRVVIWPYSFASWNFFLCCPLENAAVDKRMFGDHYWGG